MEFDKSASKEEIIEVPELHDAVNALIAEGKCIELFFDHGSPDFWH